MSESRDFAGFCRQASDAQLPNIYWKEKEAGREAFAEIASAIADGRGINVEDTENGYAGGHSEHIDDRRSW